ncbi:LacI family transcriptional regulator [Paenibacillus sp. N1-5-1-14]|uniref:LacI family DNA-binding transcriptional regulator n=1 Tax=Paenibacillus radicibacter TaxID=2972488 RepID=UPI0021590812|nr:LacI family DNA-binding transcriptional regulator [Paenibacillus radicibacter]MCR8645384.1 LacI family transcriptional regulator [Paenibacillus radicibacter]
MKKTTIKDIAKEANVSIATVSYILNDVKTQTISDNTRVKVLKIAQQLKYVTNRTAQSLKIKKSGLIGIILFKEENQYVWSDLKYAKTIFKLEQLCSDLGYHVIFMQIDSMTPSNKIIMERNLDGAFLINVDQARFSTISNYFGFGIPVFVMDSYIDNSLFHKVIPDIEQSFHLSQQLLGESPQFLIMDSYNNVEFIKFIKHKSNLEDDQIYVQDNIAGSMHTFLSQFPDRPGIVLNEFLATEVFITHKNIVAISTCNCSEILRDDMKKMTFDQNDYKEVVHMMDRYIQDVDYVNNEKFFFLSAHS